ncbi:MAG: aspartyl protease family protein [Candidatus Rokubacteria bacterium]|nr:aspartyl protease family protein [Candidatus Rokubacteria bacterium]
MQGWWAVLLLSLLLLPGAALAQTYRWVDERGGVHYTEGLNNVPERYRSEARPLYFPPPPPPAPAKPGAITPEPGTTRISFKPGSPILVSAKINGGGPVSLLLDTGADRTVVAPLTLLRLGISTRSTPRAEVKGVTGTSQADVVRVDSIEVGEAKAGPLLVVAHDADLKEADGLLGRDFLDNFKVTIDSKQGVVILAPK